MIAEAEAAARQTNLTQHRRQRHQQPVRLLAMMLTLNAPARHNHGALACHLARQLTNHLCFHAADGAGPVGAFHHAVAFAQQAGAETVEPDGIALQNASSCRFSLSSVWAMPRMRAESV